VCSLCLPVECASGRMLQSRHPDRWAETVAAEAKGEEMAPRQIIVRAPATSANLGPGFDSLGMALDLWAEVVVSTEPAPAAFSPDPAELMAADAARGPNTGPASRWRAAWGRAPWLGRRAC